MREAEPERDEQLDEREAAAPRASRQRPPCRGRSHARPSDVDGERVGAAPRPASPSSVRTKSAPSSGAAVGAVGARGSGARASRARATRSVTPVAIAPAAAERVPARRGDGRDAPAASADEHERDERLDERAARVVASAEPHPAALVDDDRARSTRRCRARPCLFVRRPGRAEATMRAAPGSAVKRTGSGQRLRAPDRPVGASRRSSALAVASKRTSSGSALRHRPCARLAHRLRERARARRHAERRRQRRAVTDAPVRASDRHDRHAGERSRSA